jgi:hypothetical protein
LIEEKKGGQPLDPVCNFHLRNGASIERINWMADLSEQRLSESAGLMVNYLYPLSELDTNYQSYLRGQIPVSPQVQKLSSSTGFILSPWNKKIVSHCKKILRKLKLIKSQNKIKTKIIIKMKTKTKIKIKIKTKIKKKIKKKIKINKKKN